MSNVLQGAKTKKYDQVPVSSAINGESKDNLQHVSVQEISGERAGLDVVNHGMFALGGALAIQTGSAGKKIVITGHGARKGDIMKMTSGNSIDQEIPIIGIEDANTFYIATQFDIAIADTVQIYRIITPTYNRDGSIPTSAPAGGATSANQALQLAQETQIATNTTRLTVIDKAYVDLSGLTTAAYTTIIAATAAASKKITYFESTGQAAIIAINNVDTLISPPGGFNGQIELSIPAGASVKVKGLSGNGATSTYCVINLLG